MEILILAILVVVGFFIGRLIFKQYKTLKVGSIALVTGGVKTGKSTLAIYIAISNYKRKIRQAKFRNFFRKIFDLPLEELPLLYSNIPLTVPYVPITQELLRREERFVYNSVAYIGEVSLVADSQMIKDKELNDSLLAFFKLFGHETKGGLCVMDSQCVSDCHYSLKRVLSEYFYIHHLVKWIPFFMVAYLKECRYSEDGSIVQSEQEDTEVQLKRVIIPKKYWKYFDSYCYSALTDKLPVNKNVVDKVDSLKATKIVSFKKDSVILRDFIIQREDLKKGDIKK